MESAVSLCLMKIFTEIPEEIIDLAFKNRKSFERDYTLDQMITSRIIHNRVLKMMNLFGGKIKQIHLLPEYMEKLHREFLDAATAASPFAIYRIPPDAREGREIIDVIDAQFISQVNLNITSSPYINRSNSICAFGHAILNGHTGESLLRTPNCEVLSGNMIKMSPIPHTLYQYVVTVRLENDKEFTNLSNNVLDTLSDYAVACTKLFIYNTLIIPLDRGAIESGQMIESVLRIVESYSDSAQRCKELEESLSGAVQLSPEYYERFAALII